MKTVTVTRCARCPLLVDDEVGTFCRHPDAPGHLELEYTEPVIENETLVRVAEPIRPAWCPLQHDALQILADFDEDFALLAKS